MNCNCCSASRQTVVATSKGLGLRYFKKSTSAREFGTSVQTHSVEILWRRRKLNGLVLLRQKEAPVLCTNFCSLYSAAGKQYPGPKIAPQGYCLSETTRLLHSCLCFILQTPVGINQTCDGNRQRKHYTRVVVARLDVHWVLYILRCFVHPEIQRSKGWTSPPFESFLFPIGAGQSRCFLLFLIFNLIGRSVGRWPSRFPVFLGKKEYSR